MQRYKHHIDTSDQYVVCDENESLDHIFQRCGMVSSEWEKLVLQPDIVVFGRKISTIFWRGTFFPALALVSQIGL